MFGAGAAGCWLIEAGCTQRGAWPECCPPALPSTPQSVRRDGAGGLACLASAWGLRPSSDLQGDSRVPRDGHRASGTRRGWGAPLPKPGLRQGRSRAASWLGVDALPGAHPGRQGRPTRSESSTRLGSASFQGNGRFLRELSGARAGEGSRAVRVLPLPASLWHRLPEAPPRVPAVTPAMLPSLG